MDSKKRIKWTVEGTYMGKMTTLFITAETPLNAMKTWCKRMKADIMLVAFSYVNCEYV
jgi:hypothetical protein